MSQSRLASLVEAKINTVIGFFLSMIVWQCVGPMFGYDVTIHDNLAITSIFTVVSVVRSYTMRRLFNWYHTRKVNGLEG